MNLATQVCNAGLIRLLLEAGAEMSTRNYYDNQAAFTIGTFL